MKKLRRLLPWIPLILFAAVQFVRPADNSGEISETHLFSQQTVPADIRDILQHACLDCHSDQTRYRWFHRIAPASWMVAKHIDEGKKEMNLSGWGNLDTMDKITLLGDICSEVKQGTMPLKSYRLMHPKARLTDEQIKRICEWSDGLAESLFGEEE